jgi:GNAT superfamily N-acetyltransferase
MKEIKILSYTGESIRQFLPDIARLRMEVFLEYPFLYAGDENYEMKYLEKFITSKDAVAAIAFDGKKIIGASTGLPFTAESQDLQKPFTETGLHPKDYFYFGESVLQKQYRRLGIGHRFFDEREKHARKLGRFKYLCFCTVKRAANDPRRPPDFVPHHRFWQKRGFKEHPELTCMLAWQEIGEKHETLKEMVFWIKQLS